MNQVIDYGVAEEGSSDRKTFAGYIRATKVCPECGKPLQLKKSQKKKGHYSESNLIHFPGGALAKSKVFSYALTRV